MTEVCSRQRNLVVFKIKCSIFQYENDDIFPNVVPMDRPNPPEPTGLTQPSTLPDEKFKGFEIFLDIENEKDITVPNSMQKQNKYE